MSTRDNFLALRNRVQMAITRAESFVAVLPPRWPAAEVDLDNDGDVSFEWIIDNSRRLSLSIGPDGRIPYAWINGQNRAHGVANFSCAEVPKPIADGMSEVLGRLVAQPPPPVQPEGQPTPPTGQPEGGR